DPVPAAQDLRGRPRHHVRHHPAQEAAPPELHLGVLRYRVLPFDLQVDHHSLRRDPEAHHPPDVDALHLHGVAPPNAARVAHEGGDDVAAPEHGGVGEGEEGGEDGGHAHDHERTHPELAVPAAGGGRGRQGLLGAHDSSMILRAAAAASLRSAKARTTGSSLLRNSSGVPTKRRRPCSRRAIRREISSACSMSWVTRTEVTWVLSAISTIRRETAAVFTGSRPVTGSS